MSVALTEAPWNVQLAGQPLPKPSLARRVDVVQTGMPVGMRALDAVRRASCHVGPVMCCVTHQLVHIPVESDTAHRWHAPQALCRPGEFTCSVPGSEWAGHECRRIWLMPHGSPHAVTDSRELHHRVALARAAPARSSPGRRWESRGGR